MPSLSALFSAASAKFSYSTALHRKFWGKHPALKIALSMLFGISVYQTASPVFFLGFFLFLSLAYSPKTMGAGAAVALAAAVYASTFHSLPILPREGVVGRGIFHPESLKLQRSPFGLQWVYLGTFTEFEEEEGAIWKKVPVSLSLQAAWNLQRVAADKDYLIHGRLKGDNSKGFQFKPSKWESWEIVAGSFSWAEKRYKVKQVIRGWIEENIRYSNAAHFLSGLATGELDDKALSNTLSRFGVQHLMAVSGFHFSLIAAFLGCVLYAICGKRMGLCLLFFSMSVYFFLIGPAPSVIRAYLSIALGLAAVFLNKRASACNIMGVCLIALILLDPLFIKQLGFQFSFLATAAIILGFQPFLEFLGVLSPVRSVQIAKNWELLDKLVYCGLSLFKRSLALTLAVHLVTVPLTLYYFHKFPLLGLFYNLFYPAIAGICLALLGLSVLFPFLHPLNADLTESLLNSSLQLPPYYDLIWRVQPFAKEWVFCFIFLILSVLVVIYERSKSDAKHPAGFIF